MKPSVLLRIASVIALLQFAAHTMLFLTYTPSHGPEELAVLEAMRSHAFAFKGSLHSYWDFYFGYGLMSALTVLIEAVLFWQLASLARTDAARIRPIVALFCVANVGFAALCLKYFFITPVVPDLLLAVCLGLAFISTGPLGDATAPAPAGDRRTPS